MMGDIHREQFTGHREVGEGRATHTQKEGERRSSGLPLRACTMAKEKNRSGESACGVAVVMGRKQRL